MGIYLRHSEMRLLSDLSMKTKFKLLELHACSLQRTRIDIWQYPLDKELPKAFDLLNIEETERAQRFYFERHQRRFTIARAMLRLILAQYVAIPAKQLTFTHNKYGKPALENAINLQFNLSHSGDMALLAIGQEHPLGIDLEFFSARPYVGMATHMFSPKECIALGNMHPMLRAMSFFHIWSQKEALIKACGLGLSYPTQQFDVSPLPLMRQQINDTLHKKNWEMVSFMPHIACCAALCHHSSVEEIRYKTLTDLTLVIQDLL
jgi:4'-phosphopantetheinyl transferase